MNKVNMDNGGGYEDCDGRTVAGVHREPRPVADQVALVAVERVPGVGGPAPHLADRVGLAVDADPHEERADRRRVEIDRGFVLAAGAPAEGFSAVPSTRRPWHCQRCGGTGATMVDP